MNRKQLLAERKAGVISQFQRFKGDTGSPEVQVAVLTERIRDMMGHFRTHRKDHSSMRGLQAMLNQRRALLSYLRRSDFEAFCFVLHRLGLRDNSYARQARFDKYRVGSRLGSPAEPIKRYGHR
ncbi:MAG: hypothetical protein J3K34DRAFT_437277 [Monoraphidium minutum]|nr:MAG: hypothetical protein J3K34DRAFT_437277 [Monoraphidium minutum]